jgi:hypothetical protein
MNIARMCHMLAAHAVTIAALTSDLTEAEASVVYIDGQWSFKQVLGHLHDEEQLDFRTRVFQTMTAPESRLPSIDPERWVITHHYAEQKFSQLRDAFLLERRNSIASLEGFSKNNWEQPVNAEQLTGLTAGDILWSWVAHDTLHIRQLTELRYAMIAQQAGSHAIGYAGEW